MRRARVRVWNRGLCATISLRSPRPPREVHRAICVFDLLRHIAATALQPPGLLQCARCIIEQCGNAWHGTALCPRRDSNTAIPSQGEHAACMVRPTVRQRFAPTFMRAVSPDIMMLVCAASIFSTRPLSFARFASLSARR